METQTNPYIVNGEHIGYCNGCGWEGDVYNDCEDCLDGEMVTYDDDPDPDDSWADNQ